MVLSSKQVPIIKSESLVHNRDVLLTTLRTLAEPLCVWLCPATKVEDAGNDLDQTLLELHGHLPLHDDVFDLAVELHTERAVFVVVDEVDVPDGLELLQLDLLLVVVEARHVENGVHDDGLARVDLKADAKAVLIN